MSYNVAYPELGLTKYWQEHPQKKAPNRQWLGAFFCSITQ